jgi:prevent-host-death family protein
MATLPKPLPPAARSSKAIPDLLPTQSVAKRNGAPAKSISASKAKTHLLELLKDVDVNHQEVTITKRGRPIARLVPVEPQPARDIFGYMKGTFKITGDIVSPEPDIWEAMS